MNEKDDDAIIVQIILLECYSFRKLYPINVT